MNRKLKSAYDAGVSDAFRLAGLVKEAATLPQVLGLHMLGSAIPGSIAGALAADEGSRLRGAGYGALLGGALGTAGAVIPAAMNARNLVKMTGPSVLESIKSMTPEQQKALSKLIGARSAPIELLRGAGSLGGGYLGGQLASE